MRDIETGEAATAEDSANRRQALRRMGRFVAVTAPSVALLLAAGSKPSRARAVRAISMRRNSIKLLSKTVGFTRAIWAASTKTASYPCTAA